MSYWDVKEDTGWVSLSDHPNTIKRELHSKKSRLEVWLDYHNHEMELVRTIVPIVVLIVQTFILIKVL